MKWNSPHNPLISWLRKDPPIERTPIFKSYIYFGGGDVVVVVFFALSKLHFSLSKREMGGRGRRGGEARSHTFWTPPLLLTLPNGLLWAYLSQSSSVPLEFRDWDEFLLISKMLLRMSYTRVKSLQLLPAVHRKQDIIPCELQVPITSFINSKKFSS